MILVHSFPILALIIRPVLSNMCIVGNSTITNKMATVTISGLQCGVTYNITAEGRLNDALVGPRSSHGSISAGPCPVIASEYIYKSTYIATYIHATRTR